MIPMRKGEPMKKEWKMDAYLSLKQLRNARMVDSHMSLEHLLQYAINKEAMTNEEATQFFNLYRKLVSVEDTLSKDLYEDDTRTGYGLTPEVQGFLDKVKGTDSIEVIDEYKEKAGPGVCVDTLFTILKFNEETGFKIYNDNLITFQEGEYAALIMGLEAEFIGNVSIDRISPDKTGGFDWELSPTPLEV